MQWHIQGEASGWPPLLESFFLLSYPYSLSNTVECMFEALLRQKLKIGCDRNIYNKLHLESADTNANHFSKTSTKFEIWSRFTD